MAGATTAPNDITVQSDASGTAVHTLQAVGQTTAAFSHPVVLASDQTPVPVDTVIKAVAVDRGGLTQGGASGTPAVVAGGTGNAVGDVLTVVGGTLAPAVTGGAAAGLPTQLTVTAVSSGAVTASTVSRAGAYVTAPTGTLATTSSGTGSGATFTVAYSPISFQVMPANTNRRGTEMRNPSYGTGTIYFTGLATATADYHSFDLPVGGYKESAPQHVGTGAINMIGTVIGQPFYAREF